MANHRQIVIINDCSYVMATLVPHLKTEGYEVEHLLRSRSLWSKTVGLLWKIARTRKKALFHVNYALQDAYLTSKLRSLDVLHCHGSDVRWTMKTRRYGWIVKHCLKKAKTVLYATEDMNEYIEPFRPDAAWLPTPIDTPTFSFREPSHRSTLRALYFKQGYEEIPHALPELLKKSGIRLDIHGKDWPYSEMPRILSQYDIFVDRFSIPSFSKTCLEAMSCGLTTIDYRHLPCLKDRIDELLDLKHRIREANSNRALVVSRHDSRTVARKLIDVYQRLS